jgi:hypothetical protein
LCDGILLALTKDTCGHDGRPNEEPQMNVSRKISRTIAIFAAVFAFGSAACNVEDAEDWDDVEYIDSADDEIVAEDAAASNGCKGASHTCKDGSYMGGCQVSCPENMIADCKDAGECFASVCVCWPTADEVEAESLN